MSVTTPAWCSGRGLGHEPGGQVGEVLETFADFGQLVGDGDQQGAGSGPGHQNSSTAPEATGWTRIGCWTGTWPSVTARCRARPVEGQ